MSKIRQFSPTNLLRDVACCWIRWFTYTFYHGLGCIIRVWQSILRSSTRAETYLFHGRDRRHVLPGRTWYTNDKRYQLSVLSGARVSDWMVSYVVNSLYVIVANTRYCQGEPVERWALTGTTPRRKK